MAKFQFRLDTLLQIRQAARDERRVQLAQAYQADQMIAAELDRLQQELGKLRDRCRDHSGPGRVDVDYLTQAHLHELVLRAQQAEYRQQREAVAEEIERRRQALVQADREVRTLEKLREKQLRRHRQEENRREIKQIDEVAQRCAAVREDDR
jgi:flagellar FliJ protein